MKTWQVGAVTLVVSCTPYIMLRVANGSGRRVMVQLHTAAASVWCAFMLTQPYVHVVLAACSADQP